MELLAELVARTSVATAATVDLVGAQQDASAATSSANEVAEGCHSAERERDRAIDTAAELRAALMSRSIVATIAATTSKRWRRR